MAFEYKLVNRIEMPEYHILLVEDDLMQQQRFLKYIEILYGAQGQVVVSVASGAIQAAYMIGGESTGALGLTSPQLTIDLIVLDHDLPAGNGSDLMTWLTAMRGLQIPIITFSGIPQNNQRMKDLAGDYPVHVFTKDEVCGGKATGLIDSILSRRDREDLKRDGI